MQKIARLSLKIKKFRHARLIHFNVYQSGARLKTTHIYIVCVYIYMIYR